MITNNENCICLLNAANKAQIEEMQKHKWIESEKAGFDVGPAAYIDWVKKYAADWRKSFIESHVNFDCTCNLILERTSDDSCNCCTR